MFSDRSPRELLVGELLAELATADGIVLAFTTRDGKVHEQRVTFEVAERELRAVARDYDNARGFHPARWEGGVAHVGPNLGGFPGSSATAAFPGWIR